MTLYASRANVDGGVCVSPELKAGRLQIVMKMLGLAARWEDRFAIVQTIEDERLRWFGLRLIYFEARSVLPEAARLEVESYLADQMAGDGSGCLTIDQAMSINDELLIKAGKMDDILFQYRSYLHDRLARLDAYRAKRVA